MQITDSMIKALRSDIELYMSEKRYLHTLGVESTAAELAEYCLPEKASVIRCAALLHDVAKEMPVSEQISILKSDTRITDSDLSSPPAYHAFCAPHVICRDFADFANEDILSAVFNHTTGHPQMSVLDEIIFIADYIEPGRKYSECKKIRSSLLSKLKDARDRNECVLRLHEAVIEALNNTIISLTTRGQYINERTVAARNAFVGRIPMPLKPD